MLPRMTCVSRSSGSVTGQPRAISHSLAGSVRSSSTVSSSRSQDRSRLIQEESARQQVSHGRDPAPDPPSAVAKSQTHHRGSAPDPIRPLYSYIIFVSPDLTPFDNTLCMALYACPGPSAIPLRSHPTPLHSHPTPLRDKLHVTVSRVPFQLLCPLFRSASFIPCR